MKRIVLLSIILGLTAVIFAQADVDWKAKCEKKVSEIEAIIEILNPVVEYLTDAFEKHTFSPTTTEEWNDAVTQFTTGNKHYDTAKDWMVKGKYNKLTFLKLEEAWQYYVKTGVAGTRAKGMVDYELSKK